MEEQFKAIATAVALSVELVATLFIVVGAVQALYLLFVRGIVAGLPVLRKREVLVKFATWLLLALEFELAADVIRSAIAPSWEQIGQLASIAVIRTFLNYFLEKDIEKYAEPRAA